MKYGLVLITLLLAACQTPVSPTTQPNTDNGAPGSDRYSQQHDAAPADRNVALQTANPTPVYESKSRYGNHSPYRVYGVSYTVMDNGEGYIEDGIASWYGSKFHGHRTSSGEAYDMYKLSAAHKTLPLPTWAKVTNLDTGKSTIVRINDRGPFHSERLIDLSWAAAVKLGIDQTGTGRVRVEVISVPPENAHNTVAAALPSPPPSPPSGDTNAQLFLQTGAFGQLGSAQSLETDLTAQFDWPVVIRPSASLYRVWVGPFNTPSERELAKQRLADAGIDAVNVSP